VKRTRRASKQRRPPNGRRKASRAEVLFHPERLRIVQTLANAKALTAQQIAMRLPEIAPATLYRHLKRLTNSGIVVVLAERPVRGVKERTYTVTQETAVIGPREMAGLDSEERFRYFSRFVGSLLDQYARFLSSEQSGDLTAVGYRQYPLYLTKTELSAFIKDLSGVLAVYLAHEPARNRRRCLLSTVLMPDVLSPR
jgi:DNA-binding transcriptional ArsR family regulator